MSKVDASFDRGYHAFFSGMNLRENPYSEVLEKEMFDSWEQGYWLASDDSEAEMK